MWRSVIFVLFVVEGTRQLSITDFAVPDALELGENAELQCRYELEAGEDENSVLVKWWFTPLEGDKKVLLYQRIGERKPSVLRKDIEIKEHDAIELVELEADDSGTYECEVEIDGGAEFRKSEDLIAYSKGSGPNLTISTVEDGPDEDEDEDVVIYCEASDVAPMPELSITVNKVEINVTEQELDQLSEKPGLYSISINTTVSKSEVDGAEVACELFYKNANISHPAYFDVETYDPSGRLTTTETPDGDDDVTTTTEPDEADGAISLGVTSALLAITFLTQLFLFQ